MNRALRAATVGVLLFSPLALTACGAGQVNQTSSQIRDKTGPSAQIGDLSLRQVLLDYPDTGTYAKGDAAQLRLSVTNSGRDDDALVGISGDGFGGVEVASPATTGTTASGSRAPASSASLTAGNSVGGGASSPTAASGSSSAAVSSPTTTSSAGSTSGSNSLNIAIPAHSGVFIGATDAPSLFLTGLTESLGPAQHLRLTFTFEKAGQVTLDVTVSGPNQEKARSSTYDFEQQPSGTPGGE